MATIPKQCDQTLLKRSLDESLTQDQEDWLADHLTRCESCREELQRLAAEPTAWRDIETVLQQESATSGAGEEPADAEDEWNAPVDFAVNFLAPAERPDSLGRLGNIEILGVIGRGGNGVVLKGFQPELNRLVAVKHMAPHLAASAAARQRFSREAQAAAAIVHPAVMPILSVSSSGQMPYLVMPYVDCESLQDRLDREGALDVTDILRIGHQVAAGLAAAHAQGLVHRDVKPANILLERSVERVMLTDFGLARAVDDASLTRSGLIAGTPQYMSPEQARGDVIDVRSDLFSLGSVLYSACTGRPPFRGESTYGILRRVSDDTPRRIRDINSRIPLWLEAVVERLMQKSPGDRFSSAAEVEDLLRDCLAHVQNPVANRLPDRLPLPRRPSRLVTGRLLVNTGLVLTAAVVAGLLFRPDSPNGDATLQQEQAQQAAKSGTGAAPPDVTPDTAWPYDIEQSLQEVSERSRLLEQSLDQWTLPDADVEIDSSDNQ